MSSIHVESLVVEYGKHRVVHSLDLQIDEGSFVTLLGPSGCGKTTTLRSIAGLERPVSGTIRYGDRVVFDGATNVFVPPERRRPGLVFQNYGLWPHLTVGGNVAFPMKLQKVKRAERDAKVRELLGLVGLADRAGDMAGRLSGGQQQRVALARALANGSSVILYDEPLSNLDAQLRVSTRKQIKRLHDSLGTTSVLVTHDQDEALSMSDVVVVMDHGRIAQTGSPREIYENPATSYVAQFVGFENLLSGRVLEVSSGHVRVQLDGQEITLDATRFGPGGAAGFAAGDRVTLACRALNIELVPVESVRGGRENALLGRLAGIEYAGDRTNYTVTCGGVEFRTASLDPALSAGLRLGDEVGVHLPHQQLVCLPSDGHASTKETM